MVAQVVSVVIVNDTGVPDRKINIEVTLEDNTGATVLLEQGPIHIGDSDDPSAIAVLKADQMLANQKENEEQSTPVEDYDESSDVLAFTLNPRWSTDRRIARRLILWMLRKRDPRIVIFLEPLIQYLQANFNANQIANWLNLTTPQVLRINRRVNAILNGTGSVKAQMLIFDDEQEDLEDD